MKIWNKFKNACKAQNSYFIESRSEITERNLEFMQTISLFGIFIYILYYIVTLVFFRSWMISPVYALFVPCLMLFYFYARKTLRSEKRNLRNIQIITLLMYIALMAETIIMSVFPHPDTPSVYFPLFLIMGPVLFILPMFLQLAVVSSGFLAFVALALNFKSAACLHHDLFEASTAFIFSVIVILLLLQFRLQTETLKNKYYLKSKTDQLTSLLNKMAWMTDARHYILSKKKNEHYAVLFIDIDNFKKINDTFGHMEGDRLLSEVADTLKNVCRRDDILGRFGGDEFIILLKRIESEDQASQKAETILDTLSSSVGNPAGRVTCSIGVCCNLQDHGNIDTVMKAADQALYSAKRNGGGVRAVTLYL